jgi:site-specific recombinase XerC
LGLAALSSLFKYLCNRNAVPFNPVTGVERPSEGANEGKTPAQARLIKKIMAGEIRSAKQVVTSNQL